MFTYTTGGIVVENFILYNNMCVIQFVSYYSIYSCDVVILLMLCIILMETILWIHFVAII